MVIVGGARDFIDNTRAIQHNQWIPSPETEDSARLT
jgi:hypothetical protein